MVMDDGLQMIDYLLLDQIRSHGMVNDYLLSRQLRCPRTFLMDRLERLCAEGYLIQEGGALALTDTGHMAWMPLSSFHEAVQSQERPREAFRWDDEIYIPSPEWTDR